MNGPIQAIATIDQDVYVAGAFSKIGGVTARNIAKWDGNQWSSLGEGLTGGGFSVLALAVFDGGLYAGGTFDRAGGAEVKNIAHWDGTKWSPLGRGVDGIVRAMRVGAGKLYVGGTFFAAGDIRSANVASWDGTTWSMLGQGLPGEAVDSLATSGSIVYAAGRLPNGAGIQATNIAMWDGSRWLSLGKGIRLVDGPTGGANGIVRALWTSGNELFAGGGFRIAGDIRATNLARWNGRQWAPVGTGDVDPIGEVYAITEANRFLYVGGGFLQVDGTAANYVASWDGITWRPLGSGLGIDIGRAAAWALASTGSELFVGGAFSKAGGKPAMNLAVWSFPRTLKIVHANERLAISWPAPDTNLTLQVSGDLGSAGWTDVLQQPTLQGSRLTVTTTVPATNQFFRLGSKQ